MSAKPVARMARTPKHCGGCTTIIRPGERYLRHVTFPSDGIYERITTGAECAECASRYGRGALLDVKETS